MTPCTGGRVGRRLDVAEGGIVRQGDSDLAGRRQGEERTPREPDRKPRKLRRGRLRLKADERPSGQNHSTFLETRKPRSCFLHSEDTGNGRTPESLSGRARKGAPGAVPRRPGDYRIGGHRKADPPEGSVAAEVLTWRKARGLSQEQAAESFGVARKTWGRWETGERYPEAAVVARIKAG